MNVGATTLSTSKRVWRPLFGAGHNTQATTVACLRTAPDQSTSGVGTMDTSGQNLAKLCLYGATGNAAKGLYSNVYSYSETIIQATATRIYVPTFICRLKWTFSGSGGVTGLDAAGSYTSDAHINADQYFADAVELIDGDTSIRLITDTSLHVASVTVDLEGASWLAVTTDDNSSGVTEPTTWNMLASTF